MSLHTANPREGPHREKFILVKCRRKIDIRMSGKDLGMEVVHLIWIRV